MTSRKPSILVVEDDEAALFGYERFLSKSGFHIRAASNLSEARNILQGERFQAMLLDLKLPDGNSMDWIPEIKATRPELPIIVITGTSDIPTAVKAMKNGAENFLTKPLEMDHVRSTLEKAVAVDVLRRRDIAHQRQEEQNQPYFGQSKAVQQVLEFARVAAVNDTVVLLQGETGTGKGVLSRWVHDGSQRSNEPFVKLNCSSLKGDLLRSELFGHTKGAFTSAIKDREGLVEVADGGTLFLDEIGDMDIDVQAQLLTAIEERSFRRVGENKVRKSDFRLICATNRNLAKATEEGTFRRDLYYRICVFPIHLPPLRDCSDDISGFAEYFLRGFGFPHLPLSLDVLRVLKSYTWPGNVRELRNMLERAMLLSGGLPLEPSHFPGMELQSPAAVSKSESMSLHEMERQHIQQVLGQFGGDKNKACKALGISLSALYRRLEKFEKVV